MFEHVPKWAEIAGELASLILLLAFMLIILAVVFTFSESAAGSVKRFFSPSQAWARRLIFLQNKAQIQKQKKYFQGRQIQYFADLKRRHLLDRDNKKQCRALAKIIRSDLYRRKHQLTKADYKQLKAINKIYSKQGNMPALIELQQKLTNENYVADQ